MCYQLKYIGEKVVFNPATAVVEVIKELDRMASLASENLNRAMNALITLDEEDIEEVYQVDPGSPRRCPRRARRCPARYT